MYKMTAGRCLSLILSRFQLPRGDQKSFACKDNFIVYYSRLCLFFHTLAPNTPYRLEKFHEFACAVPS